MKHLLFLLFAAPLITLNAQDLALLALEEPPITIAMEEEVAAKSDGPIFRLNATGGYGYRTAKISNPKPLLENYLKKLKSGLALEVDGHFLINGILGIGLSYSSFSASNTDQEIAVLIRRRYYRDWHQG